MPRPTRLALIIALLAQLIIQPIIQLIDPVSALAASDDALYVLPYGGVDALWVHDLDATDSQALDLGAERIRSIADGPTTITDFKPLPDGALLLTDVGGQGVVWLDAQRASSRLLYPAPAGALFPLSAASAVTYDSSGLPRQLLIGDTSASATILYDVAEQRSIWAQSAFLPVGRGFISQVISQPDNQLWIGLWWRASALTGVDRLVRDPSGQNPTTHLRVANRAHEGAPAATSVLDTLDEVRDLQGLPDGGVLVTGRFIIARLDQDGAPRWQLALSAQPGLSGEFSSARLLPSGKLAAATFEPGQWTSPNLNHRVHWLTEPTQDTPAALIASSSPLTAAPRRIEPITGGGTGTLGWAGPPVIDDPLALGALQIEPPLGAQPASVKHAEQLALSGGIVNRGESSVTLARASIKAVRTEDCAALSGLSPRTLSERRAQEIMPGATLDLGGSIRVDEGWLPGSWCVFVEATTDSATRRFDQVVKITVRSSAAPVVVDPLDFERYDEDMGAGDMGLEPGESPGQQDADGGCGCATPAAPAPLLGPLWALLLAPLVVIYRRR